MNELAFLVVLALFGWCIGFNAWFVRAARHIIHHPPQQPPHSSRPT